MHAHPIVSDVGSLVATALILAIALLLSTWVGQALPLGYRRGDPYEQAKKD
jgi:hypothetical protein